MASALPDAQRAARPALLDEMFELPTALRRFGASGRATLAGSPTAPATVMIGGISANRFPCIAADGSAGWWSGLAGPGKLIDLERHAVLGLDFIADENGAAAPSPADQALLLAAALEHFEIAKVRALVGASYGGMIGLSFAQCFPDRVERLLLISADAAPHPTSTATRELQRRVVRMGMDGGRGEEALAIARGMAMLTYRCPDEFDRRFAGGIAEEDPLACSAPGAYLRARGSAYTAMMSPGRFLSLSASIDRHRCRPERISTPALLVGSQSDQLVPPEQMRRLAVALGGPAELHLLPSLYGHDMFLKEPEKIAAVAAGFLAA